MTSVRQSAPIPEALTSTGDRLFRWRSYSPLVLVPLFVLSVADGNAPIDFAWELFCFSVGMAGLLLRVYVVGSAPAGASTRGTTRPTAASLSTLGAYSVVRHPLYLANTLMWFGCALLSGTWYLPLIVLLLGLLYHERIAVREEAFLLDTFGEAFREWARRVPAMMPALGQFRASGQPFQMRKAMMQEAHGLCALGTAFLVLDAIKDSFRADAVTVDHRWLIIFGVTCAPFLAVVALKRARRRGTPI